MRRSDRLFDLISLIRDGKLHRAKDLADRLEVSLRTVYRDVATLQASGVPVEGERGVGYMLSAPMAMAPVSLTANEGVALHLAVALLQGGADPTLRAAAQSMARKVAQAGGQATPEGPALYVHRSETLRLGGAYLDVLTRAITTRERLRILYARPGASPGWRLIRPLQLEFWGQVWTLTGWCELRGAFRSFRADRISEIVPCGIKFAPESGRELKDFLAQHMAQPD